jgi:hypothetical protein
MGDQLSPYRYRPARRSPGLVVVLVGCCAMDFLFFTIGRLREENESGDRSTRPGIPPGAFLGHSGAPGGVLWDRTPADQPYPRLVDPSGVKATRFPARPSGRVRKCTAEFWGFRRELSSGSQQCGGKALSPLHLDRQRRRSTKVGNGGGWWWTGFRVSGLGQVKRTRGVTGHRHYK